MDKLSADDVIRAFDLQPLPGEGGYFRQTWYKAGDSAETPLGTCILYLVTPDSFSSLHRLVHDEIFHFYAGDPCEAVVVVPEGRLDRVILGSDFAAGMKVQHIVPAGAWQGIRLVVGGRWALLGTTMAPGFHPSGFELATEATLETFPPDVADGVRAYIAAHP